MVLPRLGLGHRLRDRVPADRPTAAPCQLDQAGHPLLAVAAELGARRQLDEPGVDRLQFLDQRVILLDRGQAARNGKPVAVPVRGHPRRGEPHAPGAQRLRDHLFHAGDFVVRGLALRALRPHHVAAYRGVPHLGDGVDADSAVQRVEVAAERLEGPRQRALQDLAVHPLHTGQRLDHPRLVFGLARRDAEAAVAHHHRRGPVPARGRRHRVPQKLSVVVRMYVPESGRHDEPADIQDPPRRLVHPADSGDAPARDGHVAAVGIGAGPVRDQAVLEDEIDRHDSLPTRLVT